LRPAPDRGGPPAANRATLELTAEHPSIEDAIRADRATVARQIREHCGHLSGEISVGIPTAWTLLRVMDFPTATADELRGMISLQMDKLSPFPAEATVSSHEVVQTGEKGSRALVAAVHADVVEALGATLREAGIRPHRVDVNVLGWWRLLADHGAVQAAGRHVLLIVDGPCCDLLVTHNGVPAAVRSLGASADLPPEALPEEVAREAVYTLALLETEQADVATAVSVWYAGEAPAALVARLTEDLALPVEAHPLESLPALSEGLARRGTVPAALDLSPPAWHAAETSRRFRKRLWAATAVLAGVWLLVMGALFGAVQVEKRQLGDLGRRLAGLQDPAQQVRRMRERVLALTEYMDRSHSALECLREVSDLLPPGIELRSFIYRKGKNVEIAGEADSVTLVYDFKKELEQSELFTAAELPRTIRTSQGKENFKMTLALPGTRE
jgi:Tfp pilus assembly protein PilN